MLLRIFILAMLEIIPFDRVQKLCKIISHHRVRVEVVTMERSQVETWDVKLKICFNMYRLACKNY